MHPRIPARRRRVPNDRPGCGHGGPFAFRCDPLRDVGNAGYLYSTSTLLSLSLLRLENPDEVIDSVVTSACETTPVPMPWGLSFDGGDGRQRPHKVDPPSEVDKVKLSKIADPSGDQRRRGDLGERSNAPSGEKGKLPETLEVVRCDLSFRWTTNESKLGVLHLYRDTPSFNEVGLSNFLLPPLVYLAVGLDRAIKHDCLKVEAKQTRQTKRRHG